MAHRIDAELGSRARSMRNGMPEPERRLGARLRSSQLGYKVRRQAVIEPYIVDFLCPWNGLVIEVDGDTHHPLQDQARDSNLADRGFTVLRFGNDDILTNIDGVIAAIAARLALLPERRKITHPTPSPGREGLAR